MRTAIHFTIGILMYAGSVLAAATSDYTVQVSATVQTSPPRITLSWPAIADATGYTVFRKSPSATAWGTGTSLGVVTTYQDSTVTAGQAYEYRIQKTGTVTGNGYILAGIEVPLVEDRGTVIFMVEDTYATDLASELTRMELDLVGDGWTVSRLSCNRADSVPSVKAKIKAVYDASPAAVKTVYLFGRVPVPYSGNSAPDGHSPDHVGAWPADVFYGDMNGTWTDTTVNNTGASRNENDNVPSDGKYDQSTLPSDLEIAVGRVDLFNMPAFAPKTERDLLRQYLNKDHNFRHKIITAQARGMIDDNFGEFSGEAFAASGWRSFAPMFGASNVSAQDYFTAMASNTYLWSYGCGGGSYTSAGGVGSTTNFVNTDPKTIFTLLFGSYHGDWDSGDNFMRAPLASATYGLTCAWAGRPHWFFHHMALGESIGHSGRLSQNNNGALYTGGGQFRGRHMALLGDPTLRMFIVAPPGTPAATQTGSNVAVSWTASADAVLGYHVYRSGAANGPYTRLTTALQTGTAFTDTSASAGAQHYMVRAIKLETSASGSYYNASQGAFTSLTVVPVANTPPVVTSPATATPAAVLVGESVVFAVAATDADNDPLTITWNYGDGISDATGVHAYAAAGIYTATTTIDDGRGGVVTSSVTVTVSAPGGGGTTPGSKDPGGDFDNDGTSNALDGDDDNDGASDMDELAAGTDPFDANSVSALPFTLLKTKASMKFTQTDKDRLQVSGVLPGLPASFDPTGLSVRVDGGGAQRTFTLDAKGQARGEGGSFRLKLKKKRNKTTKKSEFVGGDVPFSAQLLGTFAPAWADEGVNPGSTEKKTALTLTVELTLGSRTYKTTVTTSYSSKAGKGGAFSATSKKKP